MIIGVDHLALSCSDLATGVDELSRWGFAAKFREEQLPNPAPKRPLLSQYRPTHGMAWCRGQRGIAIELIEHHDALSARAGSYCPVFDGAPAAEWKLEPGQCEIPALSETDGSLLCYQWSVFGIPILFSHSPETPGIRAIAVPARDLEESERFWRDVIGCGMEQNDGKSGAEYRRFTFRSPNPAWRTELWLYQQREEPVGPPPLLDDRGFHCLALLTSGLSGDLEKIQAASAPLAAGPFTLNVGGNELNLAMLRDPAGNLVELIEFKRNGA